MAPAAPVPPALSRQRRNLPPAGGGRIKAAADGRGPINNALPDGASSPLPRTPQGSRQAGRGTGQQAREDRAVHDPDRRADRPRKPPPVRQTGRGRKDRGPAPTPRADAAARTGQAHPFCRVRAIIRIGLRSSLPAAQGRSPPQRTGGQARPFPRHAAGRLACPAAAQPKGAPVPCPGTPQGGPARRRGAASAGRSGARMVLTAARQPGR